MVDDVDGDRFLSPEPRTDSRSALLRGFRAWRRPRIIKRDEFFSDFFLPETQYIELELESEELHGAHEVGGVPPHSWTGSGPLTWILIPVFFLYIPKIISVDI